MFTFPAPIFFNRAEMPKRKPRGFFVTGTDTGVGKTVISAALVRALSVMGLNPGAMKPIESGCARTGGVLVPSDGLFLKDMAHMEEDLEAVTPYAFESPLAPLPASEIEHVKVEPALIVKKFNALAGRYGSMVVEGVGGLLVPVTEAWSVLDMAKAFGLPLIVVARPGLGTINHTLLTVRCALAAGLRVAGIVINHNNPDYQKSMTLAEETNPEVLRRLSPAPLLGEFPFLESLTPAALERAVSKSIDFALLKGFLID